jgi:hypothetical protein
MRKFYGKSPKFYGALSLILRKPQSFHYSLKIYSAKHQKGDTYPELDHVISQLRIYEEKILKDSKPLSHEKRMHNLHCREQRRQKCSQEFGRNLRWYFSSPLEHTVTSIS